VPCHILDARITEEKINDPALAPEPGDGLFAAVARSRLAWCELLLGVRTGDRRAPLY
jgi:hypothetical protein